MRTILAIQEAHDASAALMVDGEVIAAAQQERFTFLKGDYGFPQQCIEAMFDQTGLTSNDVDEVLLCSENWNPVLTKIKRNANFSVDDWIKEQHDYWKPTLLDGQSVPYYDLYKDRPDFSYDDTYPMDHLLQGYMDANEMSAMREIRLRTAAERLGVPRTKIRTVRHEECHRFYGYYAGPGRGKVAMLTAEGIGDYSNGTVSIFDESGWQELSHTRDNHLGHIYQYITLILGMKPAQHEYKVMGLAPYANAREREKSYEVFRPILRVDGLDITYDQKPPDLYFHFRDQLEGHRFDGIAGGLQQFLEELLCQWVIACHQETGLRRFCFVGGVAQNIKACKKLMELDVVDELHICPAAGDTSLPVGACYFGMWEYLKGQGAPVDALKPLATTYLGPAYGDEEISAYLAVNNVEDRYTIERASTPQRVAQLLADGKIIARCVDRMEFGLRALGNRSILADPRHPDTVRRINAAIKFRDFWMPFTPTILKERESEYLVNPKGIACPFMTMAFESTPAARRDLPAALHPADFTVRPQVLEQHHNPAYYALVKEFERLTGVGALLNTSFNLHGDPIALGPKEALHTLDNSELDALLLGSHLLLRKGTS